MAVELQYTEQSWGLSRGLGSSIHGQEVPSRVVMRRCRGSRRTSAGRRAGDSTARDRLRVELGVILLRLGIVRLLLVRFLVKRWEHEFRVRFLLFVVSAELEFVPDRRKYDLPNPVSHAEPGAVRVAVGRRHADGHGRPANGACAWRRGWRVRFGREQLARAGRVSRFGQLD